MSGWRCSLAVAVLGLALGAACTRRDEARSSGRSAGVEVSRLASLDAPECKAGAGLELVLEEPEVVDVDRILPARLRVAGRPGARVNVRLLANEGVWLSLRWATVELDATGQGVVDFALLVPESTGYNVVAEAALACGRCQEVSSSLGGPARRPEPEVLEDLDGRPVRLVRP